MIFGAVLGTLVLKEGFGPRRIAAASWSSSGSCFSPCCAEVSLRPCRCLPRSQAACSLPLIAAPMFLVSGPALVKAACRAGVIGSFPTANCRTVEELDALAGRHGDDLKRAADETAACRAALSRT